jgi:hypothetical protein
MRIWQPGNNRLNHLVIPVLRLFNAAWLVDRLAGLPGSSRLRVIATIAQGGAAAVSSKTWDLIEHQQGDLTAQQQAVLVGELTGPAAAAFVRRYLPFEGEVDEVHRRLRGAGAGQAHDTPWACCINARQMEWGDQDAADLICGQFANAWRWLHGALPPVEQWLLIEGAAGEHLVAFMGAGGQQPVCNQAQGLLLDDNSNPDQIVQRRVQVQLMHDPNNGVQAAFWRWQ